MDVKKSFLKFYILLFIILTAFTLTVKTDVYALDAQAIAEDLDHYFVPAFPDTYGQIIDRCFTEEEVKNITPVLKGLEIFGYLNVLGNIANSLDAGETTDAVIDAALNTSKMIATFLTDSTTKNLMLGSVGISAAVVAGVFVTIDITRASYKAVAESKTALDLERLYYKIETDPVLKTKSRKLGEGDPIRNDEKAVEHLWRKILSDKDFESLMKNYVVTQLNETWPEPTLWERITISSDYLREAKLLEEQKRIKSHVKGLLSEMNKVAKKREASVVLARQLREIKAMSEKISPAELEKALIAYNNSLTRLPEVEQYLDFITRKTDEFKTLFNKAKSEELADIRKAIINGKVKIKNYALIMRGLPTVGKMAPKRKEVLEKLMKADIQLTNIYNTIPKAEIDRRLTEENKRLVESVAKLDAGGVDFEFKRHECKKTFDDVKDRFYDAVIKGDLNAGKKVDESIVEIKSHIEENKKKYEADFEENKKKFNDAYAKIRQEIARIDEVLKTEKDSNTRSALYAQKERLSKQIENLNNKFATYSSMHDKTAGIDYEVCQNAIDEIRKFYEKNITIFSITLNSIQERAQNAKALYMAFIKSHGSYTIGSQTILSPEEIENLKKMIADAPPSYAGMDLKFLKNHVKLDKTTPLLVSLSTNLADVSDALMRYINATGVLRMQYYNDYESKTLPSIKFMESNEALDKIENVIKALDEAINAYQNIDKTRIPETSQWEVSDTLKALQGYKRDMETYKKNLGLATGLSTAFEQYLSKAKQQNASIEEDISYLSRLWNRFNKARQIVGSEVTMFNAKAYSYSKAAIGTTPPFLSGEKIREALDYAGIMELSKQLGLGLEGFIPEDYIIVKGRAGEGYITIKPENFNNLLSKINNAPVNDYNAFQKYLNDMRTYPGAEGYIMDGIFIIGSNFWPIFDGNSALKASAAKLKEAFIKQREIAEKIHYQKVNEEAQFEAILMKINQAITTIKKAIAEGNYDSANMYMYHIVQRDNLLADYGKLGKKRSDVDNAFKELSDLIEKVRTQPTLIGKSISIMPITEEETQKVKSLYNQFKEAYESKNVSGIIRCLSNEWTSADGGNISELQRHLSKIFNLYDEIKFTIRNFNISKTDAKIFNVNFEVTIVSRIYKKNLTHEEKSSINEMVFLDETGKAKILRTIGGTLLSVR